MNIVAVINYKGGVGKTVPIRLTQTPTICRVPLPIVRRDILHVAGVCLNRIGTVCTSGFLFNADDYLIFPRPDCPNSPFLVMTPRRT